MPFSLSRARKTSRRRGSRALPRKSPARGGCSAESSTPGSTLADAQGSPNPDLRLLALTLPPFCLPLISCPLCRNDFSVIFLAAPIRGSVRIVCLSCRRVLEFFHGERRRHDKPPQTGTFS